MFQVFGDVIHYMGIILLDFYGWVFFAGLIIWLFYQIKKLQNIEKYVTSIKWIVLEVKVDELNEKSPFAMEQIFAALHAIHTNSTWGETFNGKVVLWLSCEIVSLGGRVSYMFRLPDRYRTLLESAIFAQYPKAEIYEVEDYLKNLPHHYDPDTADFDFWGTQMNKIKQGAQSIYPIKTFSGYEHTEQKTIIDPLAGVLEVMSNLEPYELMASQLVIKPVPEDWKKGAAGIIAKLKGTPQKHKQSVFDTFVFGPINAIFDGIFGAMGLPTSGGHEEKKENQPPSLMQYLSEGEKGIITAIERSMSKISYEAHLRLFYLAPKGRLNKSLRIPEIIGAYRNFGDPQINGLKPDLGHSWTDYGYRLSQTLEQPIIKKRILTRKRHFLHNFINRDSWRGSGQYYLNTEELATLYHFPQAPNARISQVEHVQTVKSAPPPNLPVANP